jgi:Prealbumin-like fold domain
MNESFVSKNVQKMFRLLSFVGVLIILLLASCSRNEPQSNNGLNTLAVTTLKIIEDTQPNNPQDFVFTTTGGNGLPAAFSLDDDGNATLPRQQTFNIIAGNYTVVQTIVNAWALTSTCTGDNVTPANLADDRTMQPSAINILDGEVVTCTFTNKRKGSIRIIKDAVPNNAQDFTFTTTGTGWPATFKLDDDTDPTFLNQRTFNLLVPGNYTIAETAVNRWTQTSAICTGNNGTAANTADDRIVQPSAINLLPAETIICTYINTFQPTSLTLVKQVVNNNGGIVAATAWTLTASGPTLLSGTTGSPAVTNAGVDAGTYTLSETGPAGYVASAWTCSDGTSNVPVTAGVVTLISNNNYICTITNDDIAPKLKVTKLLVPTSDFGTFNLTIDGTVHKAAASHNGTTGFIDVSAGTHTVGETIASGTLSNYIATYSGDCAANGSVTLTVGETKQCTITNTRVAKLIVKKQTVGGNGTFAFTTTSLGNFNLTTTGGTATKTFSGLAPATYGVAETVPAGWVQTSVTCSDGSPVSAVVLSPGETVTCTFNNTKLVVGNLTIQKVTLGADGVFGFTSAALIDFSLSTVGGTASRTVSNLAPGTYDIAETVPSGWRLDSATCSDGSPVTAIDISENESVTCTFTNTKLGKLIVVKNTVGGNGSFGFTSSTLTNFSLTTVGGTAVRTISNVVPGTYDLAETVPSGWKLDSSNCSDGSLVTAIAIAPNETVTCTFTNSKLPKLTIRKVALGGDRSFSFTSTTLPSASFTIATASGVGSKLFNNLAVGTYNLAETVPSGWRLDSAICSDGSSITAIDLSVGEDVTCTFTNFKLSKITIVKNAIGGNDIFRFTSLALGNFSMTTSGGTATRNFINLDAGVYDVAELIPAGWALTSVSCNDGSPASAIDLADHEEVTCTFTNTLQ